MRGGLVIGLGILAGNILGFVRSALTAYLLGTHSVADGMAVAMGPVDTLNSALINTLIFAFVPVLTTRQGADRARLLRRTAKLFRWVFFSVSAGAILFAPWLVRLLGPGLPAAAYDQAVLLMRISVLSTPFAGAAALHSALLYTERRFAPSAFYQAALNGFVILSAFALWRPLGIYSFAIGYAVGGVAQYLLVWAFARRSRRRLMETPMEPGDAAERHTAAELLTKPLAFLLYAGFLALNVIITRGYATQTGPGMAAAFDYCSRCVNVVIAYLVSPVSNSLLPEVARLRSEDRANDAFRLIRRTLGIAGTAAVVSCLIAILLRQPVIALLFQRGNFTLESTHLVADVFLGFAPSMIGWSLLEIASRSLFALDRPWLPVICASIPVALNLAICSLLRHGAPETIGLGSSVGMMAGFLALFALLIGRRGRVAAEWARANS